MLLSRDEVQTEECFPNKQQVEILKSRSAVTKDCRHNDPGGWNIKPMCFQSMHIIDGESLKLYCVYKICAKDAQTQLDTKSDCRHGLASRRGITARPELRLCHQGFKCA